MKRPARRRTQPPRSQLRVADLKRRTNVPTRLLNIKVSAKLADEIARIARVLGASKTDVVVALLNEGLNVAATKTRGLGRVRG